MTDQIKEQISALLDGELPADQLGLLVRRMERDEGLRRTFGRYALVGETLRAPNGPLASAGFACRVISALDGDPEKPQSAGRTTGSSAGSRRMRWLVGTGVAASVLMAAAMIMNPVNDSPAIVASAPVAAPSVVAVSSQPDREPRFSGVSPTPEESQRMAGYLVAHSEFATPIGRRNVWSGVLADEPEMSLASYELIEAD
jgi:sigma-E factor negative regulatory protein RseA